MKRINTDAIDILGKRQSGTIDKLLDDKYLSRFKVYNSPTLFDAPDENKLFADKRCKWCGNKLKIMRDKPFAYCSSKKHKQRFICGIDKLGMEKIK